MTTYGGSFYLVDDNMYATAGRDDDEAATRCGLPFDQDAREDVESVKLACAALMRFLMDHRDMTSRSGSAMLSFDTALTHVEAAKMFAVKALEESDA